MTLTQKIENLENQIEDTYQDWVSAKSYTEAVMVHERLGLLEKNLEILKAELSKVSDYDDSNLCEKCCKAEREEDGQIYCKECIRAFNQEEQDLIYSF